MKYKCAYCEETITSNLVRIDGEDMYHISCFHKAMSPDSETSVCPKCRTSGSYWSTSKNGWERCKLCHGVGYLDNSCLTKKE